jgi:hypothetical protein
MVRVLLLLLAPTERKWQKDVKTKGSKMQMSFTPQCFSHNQSFWFACLGFVFSTKLILANIPP